MQQQQVVSFALIHTHVHCTAGAHVCGLQENALAGGFCAKGCDPYPGSL
jgi:hypothetical protein